MRLLLLVFMDVLILRQIITTLKLMLMMEVVVNVGIPSVKVEKIAIRAHRIVEHVQLSIVVMGLLMVMSNATIATLLMEMDVHLRVRLRDVYPTAVVNLVVMMDVEGAAVHVLLGNIVIIISV